jgi:virulence-associated protein VagC
MSDTGIAKLLRNGRSQAVRLPQQFRFSGDQVRVRPVRTGVILEPIMSPESWFAELDQERSTRGQCGSAGGIPGQAH